MDFKRSARVQELLRHEISKLVQEINDPKLGFVTITSVHLSDDLSDAKVFYSVFGNDEERQVSSRILIHSIPSIRRYLGKKLESLRRIPVLNFVYDDTPERAQKVSTILSQLEHEKKENPPKETMEPEIIEGPKRRKRRRSNKDGF
jgi:ribosome-binding factor A